MGHGARLRLYALAFASCAIAGCSGAAPHQARHLPASQPPARPSARSSPSGPVGSPGNPLMLSCTGQSLGPAGALPAPDDLITGPLDVLSGKKLATADPAGYGDRGEYKIPVAIGPGATVADASRSTCGLLAGPGRATSRSRCSQAPARPDGGAGKDEPATTFSY